LDRVDGIFYGPQPASLNGGGRHFLDIGFDDWRLSIVYQVDFYSGPINPATSCPSWARHAADTAPT
jgi:hypothetical protein